MNNKDNITNVNEFNIDFPFKGVFSLLSLINFWKKLESGGQLIGTEYARKVNDELNKAPELFKPIEDMSVIEKHRPLVNALMSAVISPASYEYDYYAALDPFTFDCFFETPAFKKLNLFKDKKTLFNLLVDSNTMLACTVLGPYTNILSGFYKISINYEFPLIYSYQDEKTGLEKHMRIRMLTWFTDVKKVGELKPISHEDKKLLFENLTNLDFLKKLIPSDTFEFSGFLLFNAVDITDQQIISSMKYDLMEKDSIAYENKINNLQQKFRSLLRKPELRLGIAALDEQDKNRLGLGCKMGKSFVLSSDSNAPLLRGEESVSDSNNPPLLGRGDSPKDSYGGGEVSSFDGSLYERYYLTVKS